MGEKWENVYSGCSARSGLKGYGEHHCQAESTACEMTRFEKNDQEICDNEF